MSPNNQDLLNKLQKAAETNGPLIPTAATNAARWLNASLYPDWAVQSVTQLIDEADWIELNDRFYKTLAFGTGGIRGRTISRKITKSEMGTPTPLGRPQYPAAGTNAMNYFNVHRATQGLVRYVQKYLTAQGMKRRAKIVFAHDTRHFSREFAELAARVVSILGGDAFLFESERPTPELSFAVRHLKADAGVVVTASHNPSHDNGYKVYFSDGAQVVEPHASGIINEVNSIQELQNTPVSQPGQIMFIGEEIDRAYLDKLATLVLDEKLVREQPLKIVYSPLHGTGMKLVPKVLERFGARFSLVQSQSTPDGRFPTVQSPNPENAEALSMAIKQAIQEQADLVCATDPDSDRMGVAVRNPAGEFVLLSGNQIGSLLAYYRLDQLFKKGILNDNNRKHAVLIKTFVTTEFQRAIAGHFGVQIVDTLTGFKYNGAKLKLYEDKAFAHFRQQNPDQASSVKHYDDLDEITKRDLRLKYSRFYVFGGEESYGYSAADFTRDKDANAAVLMFVEMAAQVKSLGITVPEWLDRIYLSLGYYAERLGQLVYEGAIGAQKIKQLLSSYETKPPTTFCGQKVVSISNFRKDSILDIDGEKIPSELMIFFTFSNGCKFAVRGSGTEPKIKYYLFSKQTPPQGRGFTPEELSHAKEQAGKFLDQLWREIESDAHGRTAS